MKHLLFSILALVLLCVATPQATAAPLLEKVRSGDDVTVVLLGTSLTANGTWPGSLQTWLNSESGGGTITVINQAVSGKASDHGLSTQTPAALSNNPDAVFIEFSINDAADSLSISLAQAEDNLNDIIDAFLAQDADTNIILQTMNNTAANTSPFSPRTNLAGHYQMVRDTATARDLTLIDHYANWIDLFNNDPITWNSYMEDSVHPNALGQANVLFPETQAVLLAQVPEPSSLVLLGLGGLCMMRRRRSS